jgi:cytidylate kinase
MSFVVTIDGPSAAGKSTTARALAERLGVRVLDTGAFYRALALRALRRGVPMSSADGIIGVSRDARIEVTGSPLHSHVLLDGEDVSEAIRTPEVSEAASRVAAVPEVRRQLVRWQRAMADAGPLVGEGRDLGTVVFPDADVKIFLDADLETRARRRHHELAARGISAEPEAVREDLARRDERDRTRTDSPLRPADGATIVDTSGMDMEAQVLAVLDVIRAHPRCPEAAPGKAPGRPGPD